MYFFLKLRTAILILLCLFLASCSTLQSLPPDQQVKSHGLVVAAVISNTVAISTLHAQLTGITIKSSSDGTTYNLWVQKPQFGSTQIFSGMIPQGNYKIISMYAESPVGSSGFYGAANLLDSFTVEPGKITNLQTIIYQPLGNREVTLIQANKSIDLESYTRQNYPLLADLLLENGSHNVSFKFKFPLEKAGVGSATNQGLIATALIIASENASKMKKQLQWDKVHSNKDLVKLAKKSTLTLNNVFIDDDNNAYFGSKLGQVLTRDSKGHWDYLDTGSIYEVLSVYKDSDGLYAGLEDGQIIVTRNKGLSWDSINTSTKLGPIVHISKTASNQLLVVTREGGIPSNVINVYMVSKDNTVNQIKSVNQSTNTLWTMQPSYFKNIHARTKNKLFIAKDASHIEVYDLPSNQWSTIESKDNFQLLKSNNNSNTLILVDLMGLTRNHFISNDEGKSWSLVKAPHMSSNLHFSDKNNGYGVVINMGILSSSTGIIKTVNGGKNWQESKEMTENCVNMIVIDNTEEVLCSTPSGKIMSTKDGNSWLIERANY
ncbi:WD40/YVTN/BNR-like repeat-containing protein [Zooshikella ganghwensis]|uniref:Photosynthesis system II assembly factor Ycf48/Hcf136-like domain-containing protein n=1 Tax=Zooshikella ganghwensis TaxID=202772 RepID=A0A4P9VG82_9GAMM|nr:hypothetical protein [Zooshikella ganghwensis]RDH41349.1 hypothetical protein B9G39_29200 [Zooshikella ganghwensis]RDH41364.1 hypothetical protein B9G39_29275 [Zooshikella ganghwensis]